MTDKGPASNMDIFTEDCWALTDLMEKGGALLTGTRRDMNRSRNRVRTKLPTDGPGQYSGPPNTVFSECSMR